MKSMATVVILAVLLGSLHSFASPSFCIGSDTIRLPKKAHEQLSTLSKSDLVDIFITCDMQQALGDVTYCLNTMESLRGSLVSTDPTVKKVISGLEDRLDFSLLELRGFPDLSMSAEVRAQFLAVLRNMGSA